MKRITAFLGCVCLFLFLLCPAVSAQAAELNSFLTFHEIVTEEHQNDLLVYGTVLPENGSLTVSIDSQQISDPVLTTVRQEKLPTTVYCLVDISTHMSKEQIEQQKTQNEEMQRILSGDADDVTEWVARDSYNYAAPNERIFVDVTGN